MRAVRVLRRYNVGGRRFLHLTPHQYFKCLDSALNNTVDKRNIGIIAHIDAGKTTTTEQLLYLTGLIPTVGDVDHGNTITDFMELERERGITIQSAAVTCIWRRHRVNIIDTPGHVDFTLEVERALRVMDGTVTVLDGATGVQAQTLTVWRQAQKFQLPTVFFVNKMDKPLANFEMCIASIENRLGQSVLPIVVPVMGADGRFAGLVNVVERTFLDVTGGNANAEWTPVEGTSRPEEVHGQYWERLLDGLADADDAFADRLLAADEPIDCDCVVDALRRLTLSRAVSPLACGSALRCSNTVRPVLDMVVDYLPGPDQQAEQIAHDNSCALVFKVGHDKRHGRLDYARVFRGSIRSGARLLNASRSGAAEAGIKLFTPYSDLLHPTACADAGDVVVMTGLRSAVTGDTLIDSALKQPIREADLRPYILQGIETPDPVFSCSIEPPSTAAKHKFERALDELCVEDPSLRVGRDENTGQNILQGMGELHIEVVKERLKRDYGLNIFIGKLRVGYREVLKDSIKHATFKEDCFGEKQRAQWCSIQLQLDFDSSTRKFKKVSIDMENAEEREALRDDWMKYINEGCCMALYHGPLLGFPVDNLAITLKSFSTSGRVNSALINAVAGTCVREALRLAGTQLIEPIMRLELTLFPAGVDAMPSQAAHAAVLHELVHRRADVVDERSDGHLTFIDAIIPLSETTGISTRMRELTSGLCTLHMEVANYQRVLPEVQSAIIENYTHTSSV